MALARRSATSARVGATSGSGRPNGGLGRTVISALSPMGTRKTSPDGYPIRDWAPPLFAASKHRNLAITSRGSGSGEPREVLRGRGSGASIPESRLEEEWGYFWSPVQGQG
jgi:hypothetical protein